METTPKSNFTRCYLPWLSAAAMLLLYVVTLAKTVTVTSVVPLARAMGTDWHPTFTAPLSYLVTKIIGLLPVGAQLLATNFVGALCAALSLGLLARCVSLLPQDRTQMQRDRLTGEHSFLSVRLAWVPVVFAVLVAGLQRTFWENAIVGTGEALDLLLFAYCVRCLLEYRVEEKNAWLYRLAVVYGLGITNNFAMIAFFPALIVALVWVKGWKFFRLDFLTRMFLLGLAGLSLYLLLPVIQSQSEVAPTSFWVGLKMNLVTQKSMVLNFRSVGLLPGLYALIPLLILAIRWSSSFGDQSPIGGVFANGAAVILQAGLLAFCLYMAFDPPIGPRQVAANARENLGASFVFLPCYFLGALAVGYFSGFLLLLGGGTSGERRSRRRGELPAAVRLALTVVVCAGAAFVAGRLFIQNHAHIRALASRTLHNYAGALAESLPAKPCVVLSDDPIRLYAVAARVGANAGKHIFIDTTALPEPAYRRYLRQRYGNSIANVALAPGQLHPTQRALAEFLAAMRSKYELVYLHPSFGYYFETFYPEASRLVYLLKPYTVEMTDPPVPTEAKIAEQSAFWAGMNSGALQVLKSDLAQLGPDARKQQDSDPSFIGSYYSRALNHWGVELQRAGKFDEAARFFDQSVQLNPDNVAAMINSEMNASWRKDRTRLVRLSKNAEEKLATYRAGLMYVLGTCGPVDEPSFCMEFANLFVNGNLFRQAGQMVRRALHYSPGDIINHAALANLEVLTGQPDRALRITDGIRRTMPLQTNAPVVQVEVDRIESTAHFLKEDMTSAERIAKESLRRFPDVDAAYDNLWRLYVTQAERVRATNSLGAATLMTNALRVVDGQVARFPKNPAAWFNHGNLCIYVNDYDRAVQSYSEVLRLKKDHGAALLNRAVANLRNQKLEAAKRDYLDALNNFTTTSFQVYYGLGEIAWQQQKWAEARDRYESYLRYSASAPAGEREEVRKRLAELKKK